MCFWHQVQHVERNLDANSSPHPTPTCHRSTRILALPGAVFRPSVFSAQPSRGYLVDGRDLDDFRQVAFCGREIVVLPATFHCWGGNAFPLFPTNQNSGSRSGVCRAIARGPPRVEARAAPSWSWPLPFCSSQPFSMFIGVYRRKAIMLYMMSPLHA